MAYIKSYGIHKQALLGKQKFKRMLYSATYRSPRMKQYVRDYGKGYYPDLDAVQKAMAQIRAQKKHQLTQLAKYREYISNPLNRIAEGKYFKQSGQHFYPPPKNWKHTPINSILRTALKQVKQSKRNEDIGLGIELGLKGGAIGTGAAAGGYGIYKLLGKLFGKDQQSKQQENN